MAPGDRSLSDVFQDILRNVQEIVRSEVRLAKTEIREEAQKAKTAALWLAVGSVAAIFALFFLLLTVVYALALVMASWMAALIVGVVLAVAAGALLMAGLERFKRIDPTPDRTVDSLKENAEWARQQTR